MMIAAWVLLAAALTCCTNALNPPVAAALESATHDSDNEENLPMPDKRILKYLLPSSPVWSDSGVDSPIPTGQEGTKRGYNDRNFLRFGRSDSDKRAGNRNFLRFGRDGSEDYEDETSSSPAEKRDRNFLRFGRDPGRNFLRFGRSDMEHMEQFGLQRGPLEFAQGLKDEEEKRNRNFLRFGRGNKNFLRFGRTPNKNFLRFGRSVDTETFCDDCEEEENMSKHLSATSSSALSTSHVEGNNKHMASEEHNEDVDPSAVRERNVHRAKRSAGEYYDYAVLPSHGPVSWARDYQPSEEEVEDPDLDELQDINKRSYNRNFLRFGRDRNFLRFGKRDTNDGSNMVVMTPVNYPRYIRAPTRNFIRFG